MTEKFQKPEEQKPQTAMEIAFAEAEETKRQKEVALGETLGNDIWKTLSSPEEMQKLEDKGKGVDVDVSTARTPQYMSRQRRVGFQEEINSLGHTPETASMAIANQKLEQLHQIETKSGLATEWQDEAVPLGRIMPRVVPADIGPLIQVETKKISNEAITHEEEEQAAIDARIIAAHEKSAPPEVDEPNRDLIVETPGSKAEFVGEKGTHKKWGDFEDIEHKDTSQTEGTPKEWRNKLRETVAWWASPSERLIRRNAELDADLDKIGGTEKYFRGLGEWYNKRKWYTKLAVGAGLGLGAAFSAGVSLPIALSCMSGIAAQRIAGLSTMYLKFEKKSHEEAWGKEKAFLKAAVYTAVMGLAIKEGIEYVSETESAHVVQKWLGETLGHFSLFGTTHAPVHPAEVPKIPASAPEVATQSAAAASTPEIAQPAAVAAASGEVAVPAVAPEMPGIEVTATPGHGYEYMMKRLWEDLHAKGIKLPDGADQNSDLAKLLNADEKTINAVVHRIAGDMNADSVKHGVYNADGTNARIDLGSHMTIGTDGNIQHNGAVHAPADAHLTPAYHPEVPTAPIEEPLVPLTPVDPSSSGTVPEVNVTSSHEVPVPTRGLASVPEVQATSPYEASSPSLESSPVPTSENIVINNTGLDVSVTQPHLYAGKDGSVIAYGGQKADRLKEMLNYLKSNPDKTIVAADDSEKFRAVWSLNTEGKLEQGALLEKSGLFGFLIPDSSPSPDDLTKLIK